MAVGVAAALAYALYYRRRAPAEAVPAFAAPYPAPYHAPPAPHWTPPPPKPQCSTRVGAALRRATEVSLLQKIPCRDGCSYALFENYFAGSENHSYISVMYFNKAWGAHNLASDQGANFGGIFLKILGLNVFIPICHFKAHASSNISEIPPNKERV